LVAIVTEADLRYPGPALVTVTNGATSSNPATFTLTNTINIQSFTLKTASCQGGKGDSGLLTFTGAIPTGGQVVKLLSSNPAVAGVATSLTIAGGSTTRSFYITTVAVPSPTVVTITATTNGVSAVATLTVMPASVKSISLSSHSVTGGSETMAMVTMTGMVAEGTVVKLSSTGSGAVMPDSVKVALGSKSAMFVVRTVKVTTKQKVTIKADTDGAPCSTILTIN
jgi:hypothetical protein